MAGSDVSGEFSATRIATAETIIRCERAGKVSINVGGIAVLTLERKDGQNVTIKIDADKSVKINKLTNPISPVVARMGVRSR